MVSKYNDPTYGGPSLSWNASNAVGSAPSTGYGRPYFNVDGSYADVDILLRNLDFLQSFLESNIKASEEKLQDFNLLVGVGTELENAQKAEWPSALGDHKNHISYSQYRVMRKRESVGSSYIAKEYEYALRGSWGTVAMDIARISANLMSEALRIKTFVKNNISGDVYDQSESRAIELLQDWTERAIEDAGFLRAIFEKEGQAQERYAESELDNIEPARARNYQAVLQVRLNATADEIKKLQKDFDTHFDAHSNIFYNQYLVPALQFRKEISSQIEEPKSGSTLEIEMYSASEVIDSNVISLLKDLMRRNEIYSNKMKIFKSRLAELDVSRKTIAYLSAKGALPDSPFVKVDKSLSGDEQFDLEFLGWELENSNEDLSDGLLYNQPYGRDSATPNTVNDAYSVGVDNRFRASHSLLVDLLSADAHPQYLLKDGGTITGDILVEDGVTIDGIDLSAHVHDGTDGSAPISGSAIIEGTLPAGVVDVNDLPDAVDDLTLVQYNTTTTLNGDTVYEAVIAWEGPENVQFEIQLHRIGT